MTKTIVNKEESLIRNCLCTLDALREQVVTESPRKRQALEALRNGKRDFSTFFNNIPEEGDSTDIVSSATNDTLDTNTENPNEGFIEVKTALKADETRLFQDALERKYLFAETRLTGLTLLVKPRRDRLDGCFKYAYAVRSEELHNECIKQLKQMISVLQYRGLLYENNEKCKTDTQCIKRHREEEDV
jgi:hypothetical protein